MVRVLYLHVCPGESLSVPGVDTEYWLPARQRSVAPWSLLAAGAAALPRPLERKLCELRLCRPASLSLALKHRCQLRRGPGELRLRLHELRRELRDHEFRLGTLLDTAISSAFAGSAVRFLWLSCALLGAAFSTSAKRA